MKSYQELKESRFERYKEACKLMDQGDYKEAGYIFMGLWRDCYWLDKECGKRDKIQQ